MTATENRIRRRWSLRFARDAEESSLSATGPTIRQQGPIIVGLPTDTEEETLPDKPQGVQGDGLAAHKEWGQPASLPDMEGGTSVVGTVRWSRLSVRGTQSW